LLRVRKGRGHRQSDGSKQDSHLHRKLLLDVSAGSVGR
jgi:hypothetical protein